MNENDQVRCLNVYLSFSSSKLRHNGGILDEEFRVKKTHLVRVDVAKRFLQEIQSQTTFTAHLEYLEYVAIFREQLMSTCHQIVPKQYVEPWLSYPISIFIFKNQIFALLLTALKWFSMTEVMFLKESSLESVLKNVLVEWALNVALLFTDVSMFWMLDKVLCETYSACCERSFTSFAEIWTFWKSSN